MLISGSTTTFSQCEIYQESPKTNKLH